MRNHLLFVRINDGWVVVVAGHKNSQFWDINGDNINIFLGVVFDHLI
jgi:hypothetical protein